MLTLNDPTLLREQAFVGGEWIDADDGGTVAVTNPANGQTIGTVPMCGTGETVRAIAAAAVAQRAWRDVPTKERAAVLRRLNDLMLANQDDLALIMTTEQGKPLAESKGEIAYAASFIEWFADEARRTYGDAIPAPTGDRRILALKQPIGVTAAITPWNFPTAMLTRKVGPALAAGCSMVVKPATLTPFSALAFAELAVRAGVPKGLLSVISGSAAKIGGEMTRSPIVRKLTFTGSTEVGRTLMRQSADTIKKLSLELGGNAPFIVFDDADIDAAIEGAMISKYRNNGQTCVCANRIYVQRGVLESFTQKLVAKVKALKVGDGTEAGVTQGPLIDSKAVAKIEEHVARPLRLKPLENVLIDSQRDGCLGRQRLQPPANDATHDMPNIGFRVVVRGFARGRGLCLQASRLTNSLGVTVRRAPLERSAAQAMQRFRGTRLGLTGWESANRLLSCPRYEMRLLRASQIRLLRSLRQLRRNLEGLGHTRSSCLPLVR